MLYTKEVESAKIENALHLSDLQVIRIKSAITKAYDQEWHKEGPNIDQINAVVAPYITTPEEAFYAATVILTDVFGSIMSFDKINKA